METVQAPARVILTPIITDFIGRRQYLSKQALQQVDKWRDESSHRVMFDRRFKLMIDGAIYSGLAQFKFPGYIDGHEGVWMVPHKVTEKWAQAFLGRRLSDSCPYQWRWQCRGVDQSA